ncbi:MAG: YdeI/OmpD-associated family protein [Pseudomonadota bacterium]
MSYYTHEFETTLEKFGVGKKKVIWYNVLFLCPELQTELPFDQYPRLRVEGEIADVPIENAFIPTGDGRYYVIVAPHVIDGAELRLGDTVEMRFRIADQDHVNVPEALQDAIDGNDDAKDKWAALTPGKKRMFAAHVNSAKTDTTTEKRVIEAMEAIGREISLRDLQNERKSRS